MNDSSDSASKHVVIVGGGLAGLSAAEALVGGCADRFRVTVLEAKQVVGGRAGSFYDPTTGETVDYCQHVAMGCCTNLIGLMRRCGLSDQFHRYRELMFLHPNHPPSRFAPSPRWPAPLHLVGALSSLRFLTRSQRSQVRRAMWRLFRTPSPDLVGSDAHQWLRSVGQDAETIRDFWDVILVSALGERPQVVCMSVARKVIVDGFAGAVGASDVLVPRLPLRELFGTQLRHAIEQLGVEIVTRRKVTALRTEPDLLIETQNDGVISADHVIVAVPWHATRGLLSPDLIPEAATFANFPASPISGLHLWFDRQLTDRHHAVMVGTVSQWLFRQPWEDKSQHDGTHYYQIVISASQAARQWSKDELLQTVLAEIRSVFPAAREAKLMRSRVVTDPNSVFSVRPEVESARPVAQTHYSWLHLAGDWTATGWPATMEGAVISGRLAAASVAGQEGLQTINVDAGLPRSWLAKRLIY